MGTLVGITLFARSVAQAKNAFQRAYARAAELNRILSDYLPDSELNQLTTSPRRVSTELYTVLQFSRGLSQATEGAFDVTIGPLTKLWRQRAPVTPEAMALVNWREVYLENGFVRLGKPGMQLDLGGIGKGYVADEMIRTLRGVGIAHALVAASGDIVCSGAPPGQKGWRVDSAGGPLTLRNAAVSTSGDTTQFFEKDGRRYSHILDPRAGRSVSDVVEVSIVAANGMTADALATAVRILGKQRSLPILARYHAQIAGQR
ncbi:MAG TPA: FAD:protein FMN transferase [Bryobacteraceae bacterium]|nr:FAD:protein FMN transferase [Bryobacteraceae bacterium]